MEGFIEMQDNTQREDAVLKANILVTVEMTESCGLQGVGTGSC